jgi:RNA polymerase sigma-70 factor (ECF subfamily)
MRSDEELLRAFAGGRRSALAALAERYERRLLDLSLAILRSSEAAEDAMQETWLRVVRYARTFNGNSSAKTWLYRIAINQCRSMLGARPTTGGDVLSEPVDGSNDPSQHAAARDESERLKAAVERLSPPLREAVLLCYTHGLTHAEAAEAMGVPIGTVKSRVHAALEELRKQLQPPA